MGINYKELEPNDEHIKALELQKQLNEEEENSLFNQSGSIPKILKWYAEEDFDDEFKKKEVYKNFWATFNKNLKLSFIQEKDRFDFECDFMQSSLTYLMTIPNYKYKFNDMIDLENVRMHWRATMTRSIGTNTGRVNERTMQATTINHMFRSDEIKENQVKPTKNNFFNKLSNLF